MRGKILFDDCSGPVELDARAVVAGMDLLKRAEAMARKLKKQGCTEWPNRLVDAVRGVRAAFPAAA
ncbi:MAG: hypothetical protein NTV25_10295 [Methanothrix sp.]|nr:hypothetical protein [Methanothrix sp.]